MTRRKQIQIYKKIRQMFFALINFFFLNPVNLLIFKKVAEYGYDSNKCLKYGFLPLPVHFYSPVPDIEDLQTRKVWDKKSALSGIDFNPKRQLTLLKKLGEKFAGECDWPLNPTKNPGDYYIDNTSFGYGCAAALYSMVRYYQPKRIIEIGSGNSSRIISQAIKINKTKIKYTIIDPYPGKYISRRFVKFNELIKRRVELVDPEIFAKLDKNDILFIDSSHTVKIADDVNFLFLDVLPKLKPGVIVHIHDIALPYEYSKTYATSEFFRQFWTEQYLLQAFLSCNLDFEVLLGMNYLMTDHLGQFSKAFPYFNPEIHKQISGSFWIRRKIKE